MNKTIEQLKDQITYHKAKLKEYETVLNLVQENPETEQALSNLLDALQSVNLA